MFRKNRGAARVSIAWMITVMVLFFAALAFGFVASSDFSNERDRRQVAETEKAAAVAEFQTEADRGRAISLATGWFDANSADPRTDLAAMAASLETFKDGIGITEASAKTLQDVLPLAQAAYARVKTELDKERNAKNQFKVELDTTRQTVTDVTQSKDQVLSQLRQQQTDEADKYTRNEQDAAKRLAAAQAQVNDYDTELRDLRRERDDAVRALEKEMANLKARMKTLAADLKFQKQPDLPDATILATSGDLPLAWIDIGANDRLARGTRFRVTGSGPGAGMKAWATVTKLEAKTAEVELSDYDRFDPVVKGDVLTNPIYSPKGERHAVLAGRFSSPSTGELSALLGRMGIRVQEAIDIDTDYLIVGAALYTDDDGEVLEEPREPQELDVYREAEGIGGINIIPVSDLRGYFVF